jgi:hypothetical protein
MLCQASHPPPPPFPPTPSPLIIPRQDFFSRRYVPDLERRRAEAAAKRGGPGMAAHGLAAAGGKSKPD